MIDKDINEKMKLAVIYDSKTGNTRQAGEWIVEGMLKVYGLDAKAFSIHDIDDDFVRDSKGIIVGSPSYAALMTPELHAWLLGASDKLEMAGKLGGAFSTEQYTHGGGDLVIQSILTRMLVGSMLCYSGGSACGRPYIHLGPVGVNSNVEKHNMLLNYKDNFFIHGKRFAEKACEIFR